MTRIDAMTNERPYRRALTTKEAVQKLISGKGSQFDPRIVDAMIQYLVEKENFTLSADADDEPGKAA